jgi:hypothetical protein
MVRRRSNRDRASAFDQGPEHPAQVDSLLFGELERVEAERVIVRPVSLDELIIDETIQVRLGGLDEDHVEYLVQVLLNGGEFKDPIITARDDRGEWLSDGFHRSEATRRALALAEPDQVIAPLRAQSHPGGREVAITLAEDGNLKHGKQLSNEEKKGILWARLERGHDWAQWSNRRIAAELGVNEITIRRWRADLTATNVAVGEPTTRIGLDGRAMDVSGIQAASEARHPAPDPPRPATREIVEDEQVIVPGTGSGIAGGEPFNDPGQVAGDAEPETRPLDDGDLLDGLNDFIDLAGFLATRGEAVLNDNVPVSQTLLDDIGEALAQLSGWPLAEGTWQLGLCDLLEQILDREHPS